MTYEGNGIMPVYDVHGGRNVGDGMYGGGWCWIFILFILLAWGGMGGIGRANAGMNEINNDFLYTNLKNTMDNGFMQTANQNFGIQKDMCQSFAGVQMGMSQGFAGVNAGIANLGYQMQNCCCETNRNIDAVRAENYKNTCEITNAIHAEGEATRALINANTMQDLRDKLADRDRDLQTANFQLSQQAQSATLINVLRPTPIPAYNVCSPYEAVNYGSECYGGCGCNRCGCN